MSESHYPAVFIPITVLVRGIFGDKILSVLRWKFLSRVFLMNELLPYGHTTVHFKQPHWKLPLKVTVTNSCKPYIQTASTILKKFGILELRVTPGTSLNLSHIVFRMDGLLAVILLVLAERVMFFRIEARFFRDFTVIVISLYLDRFLECLWGTGKICVVIHVHSSYCLLNVCKQNFGYCNNIVWQ